MPAARSPLLSDEPQLGTRMLRRCEHGEELTRGDDLSTLVYGIVFIQLLRLAREAGIEDNQARIGPRLNMRHRQPGQHQSRASDAQLSALAKAASSQGQRRRAGGARRQAAGENGQRVGTVPRIERTLGYREEFAGATWQTRERSPRAHREVSPWQ